VPRITAIETQKRRADRVSIFVDGEFAVGLGAAAVKDLGLSVGQELGDADIERLGVASETDRAYHRALAYLRSRRRSEFEVRERLGRYGYDEAVIAAVVGRLTELGYVDDREFAGAWVRDRMRLKPKGRRALRGELVSKRVSAEFIEETLAHNVTETEEELARRALEARLTTIRSRGEEKGRRAVISFLGRRGFDAALARRLAEEIFPSDRVL
jgi:regulatory protein